MVSFAARISCIALGMGLILAGPAQAVERVAATPYGGAVNSVYVPSCQSGEVLTATNGRLVCTTPPAPQDPDALCGIGYFDHTIGFIESITCKGKKVASEGCPTGYKKVGVMAADGNAAFTCKLVTTP